MNEYKNESFQLFESMLDSLRADVTQKLGQIRPLSAEEQAEMLRQMTVQQQAQQQAQPDAAAPEPRPEDATPGFIEGDPTTWGNPGRNDACPCGSGKKFKHCHGRLA